MSGSPSTISTATTWSGMLGKRIGDTRVIRLIVKWLNAGVMEGTDWSDTGRGTPQGAIVSACLANVYLPLRARRLVPQHMA